MRYVLPILALCCASLGYAQPAQVQVNADCVIQFNLTASGQTVPASGGYANGIVGCNSWQIQYWNNGFGALTLAVQSAPNTSSTAAVCTPGSWGTIGGTLTFGVNPNTNTTGASSLIQSYGTNFAACVRVALTAATGSGNVTGILLGYRAAGTAGTSSGSPTVTIGGPLGQQAMAAGVSATLPNNQLSGCTRTFVNLSGSGNTQLVAGVGGQQIYICELDFATTAAEDVKLTSGTCASSPTDATGLMKSIQFWQIGDGFFAEQATITAGDALCMNQSASQAAGVTLWYRQQ